MSSQKSLGALLILISLLLLSMSFGHEYVGELMTASTLTVPQDTFEVTPNSQVVISYNEYSTWGTLQWNFNLYSDLFAIDVDLWSPKVWIDYHETYYGSFTIIAPDTPGTYTYYLKPYMYKDGTQIGHSHRKITITVIEAQPTTYTLTVNTIDENSIPLPDAEVSINTGVIGTTDSSGTVTKSDLTIGPWTVTATKEGYNSDSDSVSMTADKTVVLCLTLIEEPTPDPTEEPTPDPTEEPTLDSTEEPTPDPTEDTKDVSNDLTPPITYNFVIEMLDNSDPQKPIEDAKIIIDGKVYYSDSSGKVLHLTKPGETITVVITKEGYNNFRKVYTVTSNTVVKITLIPSGGNFFLDLDLEEDNPFYDPHGIFNTIPIWMAIFSPLLFFVGIYLIKKQ